MTNKNEEVEIELPTSNKEKYWFWGIVFFLLLVVIALHYVFAWILMAKLGYPNDWQSFSSFGGFFQVLGSLFSGLAFVALIATLNLQMRDLRTQRKLVKETIIELKDSATAQKEQSKTSQLMTRLSILTSLMHSYQENIKFLKEQNYQYEPIENKLNEIVNEIEYIHSEIKFSSSIQHINETTKS
jgi:uncharacterized protein YsxB (DUF464 family)